MTEGFLSVPALGLQSPSSVPLGLCGQVAVKAEGRNTVNKPDNMMNKPELVHFKTGVGYFPFVWETRLPNLLVTFLICRVWAQQQGC